MLLSRAKDIRMDTSDCCFLDSNVINNLMKANDSDKISDKVVKNEVKNDIEIDCAKPRMHILEPIRKLNTLETIINQEGMQLKAPLYQKATSFTIQDPFPQLISPRIEAPYSSSAYKAPTDCEENPEMDVWREYAQLFNKPFSKNGSIL